MADIAPDSPDVYHTLLQRTSDIVWKLLCAIDELQHQAPPPAPAAELDLSGYPYPEIVRAVLALGEQSPHTPALVRTALNQELERRSGLRGRSNGRDKVGNGHSADRQLELAP